VRKLLSFNVLSTPNSGALLVGTFAAADGDEVDDTEEMMSSTSSLFESFRNGEDPFDGVVKTL
jgi:hypothetical protein